MGGGGGRWEAMGGDEKWWKAVVRDGKWLRGGDIVWNCKFQLGLTNSLQTQISQPFSSVANPYGQNFSHFTGLHSVNRKNIHSR